MRRFWTASQWVRWYFRAGSRFSARGLNLVPGECRLYAKKCKSSTCSSMFWCVKTKGVPEPVPVCGLCGKEWPTQDIFDLHLHAALRESARMQGPSTDLQAFTDVGAILYRLYYHRTAKWATRVFCAHTLGESIRTIAREAPQRWSRAPFSWRLQTIVELNHEGERVVSERLQNAEIMQGGDWWQSEN